MAQRGRTGEWWGELKKTLIIRVWGGPRHHPVLIALAEAAATCSTGSSPSPERRMDRGHPWRPSAPERSRDLSIGERTALAGIAPAALNASSQVRSSYETSSSIPDPANASGRAGFAKAGCRQYPRRSRNGTIDMQHELRYTRRMTDFSPREIVPNSTESSSAGRCQKRRSPSRCATAGGACEGINLPRLFSPRQN